MQPPAYPHMRRLKAYRVFRRRWRDAIRAWKRLQAGTCSLVGDWSQSGAGFYLDALDQKPDGSAEHDGMLYQHGGGDQGN
jgi:hypothetical protein